MIWATHARPSWKAVIVRFAGMWEPPSASPARYDGRPEPSMIAAPPYAMPKAATEATG